MEEQRARKKKQEYDLLSSLPEPLIHHVLSLLSLKDIATASAVCKSWGRICSSFPVSDFPLGKFLGKGPREDMQTVQRMVRFVDATMKRSREQNLEMDEFAIDYPYSGEMTDDCLSRIDEWIAIALDNNAQEIRVALSCWEFRYPESSGPKPLSLDLVALPSSTNLKSLRSLTLDGFLDGEFLSLERLMSACGSLESLSLTCCRLEEVRISGLPNIKTVSLTECISTRLVDIEAPSLESFSLQNDIFGRCTHPCVVNVNHSPNLKSLTLQGVAGNDGWFRDFLSRFQRLQYLTIGYCHSLRGIRISNPLIEDVNIIGCYNLTGISIEAPDVRRFGLVVFHELRLPSIHMKHPPHRNPAAEVTVCLPKLLEPKPGWSHKFSEFLVGSCKSFSSLRFRAHWPVCEFELHNDIKHRWLGVIACNSEQFPLAQRRATREPPLPRAVDGTDVNGLIWTPHPTTVTAAVGLSDHDFLQVFFDKVAKKESCLRNDCTSHMDDPNIEIFTGSNK